MNPISPLSRWQTRFAFLAAVGLAVPGMAVPTVGSSNTATADPAVSRPATTPCAVQLYSNVTFADFSPKPYTYAPPAACPGPWAKVVLEADFSVTAGRQFDRTAQIALAHTNIYYGTTAEPSSTVSPSWHVERDLTDYSSLFRTAQTGEVNLGNLVNSTYTGIIHGSARVLLYPTGAHASAPRTPDAVLPLSTDPGGASLLATTASVLAPTFNLPTNIEAAYLDVVAQSQSGDEFWYTCVPDDVADELFSCGGTSFREAEVTIDGQPAGVAPVYPWIYTGAIDPPLWKPIPSVETLNFTPYRVDLTPFAGVLGNGHPHQVGVSVYNANNYFLVAASLLLNLDAHSSHVSGAITQNTLAAPQPPTVQENLTKAGDGTVTGTVTVGSNRQFTIAGYVNTSHGRVDTTVRQALSFSNKQQFTVGTNYIQNINQNTQILASVDSRQGFVTTHTDQHFSYPLTLVYSFLANDDGSGSQTVTVDQRRDTQEAGLSPIFPFVSAGLTSNEVKSTDTILFDAGGNVTGFQNRNSSQTYTALATDRTCYSRTITSANGVLTAVTDSPICGGH
jgi:hypothetical protein